MKALMRRKLSITGSRSAAIGIARGRLLIISAIFIIAYIILGVRAFDLTVLQGEFLTAEQNLAALERVNRPADLQMRGDIVDRNGVLMARSLKSTSLYADPKLVPDAQIVAQDLQAVFPELSYGSLLQKLQGTGRFAWIKRNITPDDHYKILQLGHPGLGFKAETRRVYPHGNLGAHVVGFSNIDGRGLAGMEQAFDTLLHQNGSSLALTIDVRLQHALRKSVNSAIDKHKAKAGVGLIMDVSNGEVLAATSLPDYDPHRVGAVKDQSKFNRYSLGVYEPGSTFKIFSTAALLDIVDGSLSQIFDAREPIRAGRHTINDFHAQKRILTLPEVFMHSSNIGSAMMGQKVGTQRLKEFYSDLGLLTPPDISLPEKGRPLVPEPWREINTFTASFGHGIAVSPIQLVSAVSSIVNGGLYVRPTFILPQNNLQPSQKAEAVRIVSPQTAHRMRQLLRLVVTDGTGAKADVKGYEVGGKTGTAEKIGPNGYDSNRLISSFLGVFPVSAPRYAVYVMVDEPKGTRETYGYATGGWVAAPAVAQVIQNIASILNIKPDTDKQDIAEPLRAYVKTEDQLKKEASLATY